MDYVDDVDIREQIFHNAVREYIIWLLLFILLYVSSYATICAYRRRGEREEWSADQEDAVVYRISLWICTFTLAVSGGAVLLLPMSVMANEVLLLYPNSYYLQWVNSSLIHGLWTQIFLCSNLSLFILIPFAYLLTESEGFSGSKRGIMPRVYETFTVLMLFFILLCGLAWIASALLDNYHESRLYLFDVWNFHLPYLYSCVSFLGIISLLVCTPLGFARLFTVIGQLVLKPRFLRDIEEELYMTQLEENVVRRRLQNNRSASRSLGNEHEDLHERLKEVEKDKRELEKRKQASTLQRNLGYPLVMVALFSLTAVSVLLIAQNTIELVIGLKTLPKEAKQIVLGISSYSALGTIGAAFEVIIILYFMLASIVGFYSLPFFRHLRPQRNDTPLTNIIGNCCVILILSSALPVLSRILGITNFDLMGAFGSMHWLGNFYMIFSYNIVFGVATSLSLTTKFTVMIQKEIYKRIKVVFCRGFPNKDKDQTLTSDRHSLSISNSSM